MGLDTSHNCWHGAYSSFNRFRQAIVAAADACAIWTAGGTEGAYPERCYFGWWDEDRPYSDPLEVLLVHSDCEGWIFPKDAAPLADRLEGFIEKVDAEWQPRVRQFIDGLRAAADEWQPVGFH